MHVPLIKPDLPKFESLEKQFREILSNGRITNFGRYVNEFEESSSKYLGAKHCVTTSSGTMGILFTLQALGLKAGEKVIFPSFTFMATAQAVLYAGGIPVFAEIGEDFTLDPQDLELLLKQHPETTMVIGVHMYGMPCKVAEIQAVVDAASKRSGKKIRVIYDAAHAFGSALDGQKAGTFGDAEIFSLSVTKVVVSVEGGMVTTPHEEIAKRITKMRNYGVEGNYDAWYPGLNGKMSEFHAIVGIENLKLLDQNMQVRQERARYYYETLSEQTGFLGGLPREGITHTFKDLSIRVPENLSGKRDAVIAFLKDREIETRAYFHPPVHEQKYFKTWTDRPLPLTEKLSREVITLPFYTSITEKEMDYVISNLAEAEKTLS